MLVKVHSASRPAGLADVEVAGGAGGRPAPGAARRMPDVAQGSSSRAGGLGQALRGSWPIGVVLALYAASAFVVPTLTPAPVSDDWVYARSVEILVREGELRILGLSVVTLIFQVLWGGLFAAVFGPSFGVLRLATVVLVLLGGWAFYALCRELGVTRGRSALGAAAYLFNPLAFVLGYTFMSDPYFVTLLIASTWLYVRGLRPGPAGARATLAGAAVAGLAFLVRQQGALIPLAVVFFLLVTGRLRPDRAGAARFARIVAIPAAVTVAYYLWLRFVHGIPFRQREFLSEVTAAGWGGTAVLVGQLTMIEAVYLGLFALPLVAAALPAGRRLARSITPAGWALFCAWEAAVVAAVALFGKEGRTMPFIPQYLAPWGLGPADLLAARPTLFSFDALISFTALCAAASLAFGIILCRRVGGPPAPDRAGAGIVLAVGLWQVAGILPASFAFRTWIISLDRYLLPLLPVALCLGLWALRDVRLALPVAWVVVAAFAVLAVAGTRDFLVYQGAVWELAESANAAGIPNTRLDAGAFWDGYQLYQDDPAKRPPPRTANGPWWVYLFAPETDSSYVVAGEPLRDYTIVRRAEYSSWLHREPVYLYLLRRPDVPGPP